MIYLNHFFFIDVFVEFNALMPDKLFFILKPVFKIGFNYLSVLKDYYEEIEVIVLDI